MYLYKYTSFKCDAVFQYYKGDNCTNMCYDMHVTNVLYNYQLCHVTYQSSKSLCELNCHFHDDSSNTEQLCNNTTIWF